MQASTFRSQKARDAKVVRRMGCMKSEGFGGFGWYRFIGKSHSGLGGVATFVVFHDFRCFLGRNPRAGGMLHGPVGGDFGESITKVIDGGNKLRLSNVTVVQQQNQTFATL